MMVNASFDFNRSLIFKEDCSSPEFHIPVKLQQNFLSTQWRCDSSTPYLLPVFLKSCRVVLCQAACEETVGIIFLNIVFLNNLLKKFNNNLIPINTKYQC